MSQSTSTTPFEAPAEAGRGEVTRRHIRGSNLLLFGRLLSLGINFAVTVLAVRYLSKSDYGAFSYALGLASAGASLLLLGMPRAVARLAPLYQERGDFGAMFGSLVLSTGLVAALGTLALGLAFLFEEPLLRPFAHDPLARGLLIILIALAPLQALDSLFQSMLAAFAGAGALFFRRYVLFPLLRLGAVLAVIAFAGTVRGLAWAYLAASLVGVLAYGPLLARTFARAGLTRRFELAKLRLPWREVLGFGLPLVIADVMMTVRAPLAGVVLESARGTVEVADLNAFARIAGLNMIVLQSMKQLFLPVASRFLARGEHRAIDEIYWQTTIWIAVMTFPIFVPCIAMPDTMAWLFFGPDYVEASAVLLVLALGEYASAALGLNTHTLNVYARVGFVLWTTALATLSGTLVAWLLVPRLGALGAAAGITAALLLQNALHHWGLHRYTGVDLLRRKYLRVYLSQVIALALLLAVFRWLRPPVVVQAVLVAAATLALLRMHRHVMDLGNVFPELRKLPLLGRFLFTA